MYEYLGRMLVRGWAVRATIRLHFGGHQAVRTWTMANQHRLTGPELGDAKPAQCLHMHENVRRTLPTGQKPEPAQAVEPLHHSPLEPAGRSDRDMGAWRQLGGMNRGRFIHGNNTKSLHAFRTLE